ncbi:hypothetical protein [Bradyrhizobium liaoningense]|uniref:hypothetical protein n=1 Tax=Bradyrhizobium liaoningense TaxID=43992 RepID=UPI001BAAC1EE|nr:hypothetical protein [Bradyrhizobium liaoningense]MBR0901203.1 hypothetical protein [Bradyrhizobium liaoningense]
MAWTSKYQRWFPKASNGRTQALMQLGRLNIEYVQRSHLGKSLRQDELLNKIAGAVAYGYIEAARVARELHVSLEAVQQAVEEYKSVDVPAPERA